MVVQGQAKSICIVTGEYPPQMGGVAGYTFNLAQSLARYGREVEVITRSLAGDGAALERADIKPELEEAVGVEVHTLLPVKGFGLIDCWRLFRHFHRHSCDALVFQYVPQMYGRAGIAPLTALVPVLARLGGVTTVVTMFHEIKIQPSRQPKTWLVWFFQVIQAFILTLFSHKLITNSVVHADFLNRLCQIMGREKRTAVISVGSNIPLAATMPEELEALRDSLKLTNSGPLLMIFSPFTVHKDLIICLEALKQLPDATLVCLGGNADAARYASLLIQARERGIEAQRLHLIFGPLGAAQISRWLQIADIYLHTIPLGASGRSGALAAALQHGLPVIAFRGPETPTTFKDGENMTLIEPNDLEALVSHIQNISNDAELRNKLRAGATLLYNSTASWEIIGEKFYDFISLTSGFKSSSDLPNRATGCNRSSDRVKPKRLMLFKK